MFTSEPASASLSHEADPFESSETLFSRKRKQSTTLHPSVAPIRGFYVERTLCRGDFLPHNIHARSIDSKDIGVLFHIAMERVQGECGEGRKSRVAEASEFD